MGFREGLIIPTKIIVTESLIYTLCFNSDLDNFVFVVQFRFITFPKFVFDLFKVLFLQMYYVQCSYKKFKK